MMFKYMGIAAIIIACTTAGLLKSLSLSKRVRELEVFLSALNFITTEIRYFSSPTDVIISKLKLNEEYVNLKIFNFCEAELIKTHDFKMSWGNALESSKPFLSLNTGDFETLKCFGDTFGTTDSEGEIANCEHYINSLKLRLESARTDKTKRGRMYSSLGFLVGALFAAVFI